MCGIAALLRKPQALGQKDRDGLLAIFAANLIANEDRGNSATGIALIRADGSRSIWKASAPASEFLTPGQIETVRAAFDSRTVALMGHTRKPTRGSPGNPANNQPIESGPVVGVHNGTIFNDDLIFRQTRARRSGDADSEAIFAMLAAIPAGLDGAAYDQAVAEAAHTAQGTLTVFAMDSRRPSEAVVLKKDMPLSMHYDEAGGAVHLSSRYLFLRKTFGRCVVLEELHYARGYVFDLSRLGEGSHPWNRSFALEKN